MISEYSITQIKSPNFMSRFGWIPDMIASHITEGNYTGAISWLCNPASGASSHFVVSKAGQITQLVDIRNAAWINGTRLEQFGEGPGWYGDSLLKQVRERKTNANFYSIGIEHEGFYKDNKGKLTDAQFAATVWLHKFIISEVKRIFGTDIILDREHIVGHYQVDPKRKPNCPGQNFQWSNLLDELQGGNRVLKLTEQWQWDMLYDNIKEMREGGILNTTDWETKIKAKNITVDELSWLNTIMMKRLLIK